MLIIQSTKKLSIRILPFCFFNNIALLFIAFLLIRAPQLKLTHNHGIWLDYLCLVSWICQQWKGLRLHRFETRKKINGYIITCA